MITETISAAIVTTTQTTSGTMATGTTSTAAVNPAYGCFVAANRTKAQATVAESQ
jgi:hypothetical protein